MRVRRELADNTVTLDGLIYAYVMYRMLYKKAAEELMGSNISTTLCASLILLILYEVFDASSI